MKTVFKTTGGKELVKDSSSSIYAAGDVIFREERLGTEMFIIQEGEVNIIKHINGESHTLSHLEKGDFFGEMAVLEAFRARPTPSPQRTSAPSSSTGRASTRCCAGTPKLPLVS